MMVYKWFNVIKAEHNADVVAYVIMPNHLHVILHFHDAKFDLNTIIANGKRFIAYEIINRLEKAGNSILLGRLAELATERERRKGQLLKFSKVLLTQRQLLRTLF